MKITHYRKVTNDRVLFGEGMVTEPERESLIRNERTRDARMARRRLKKGGEPGSEVATNLYNQSVEITKFWN